MAVEQNPDTDNSKYHLVSVEETEPPSSIEGGNWFHYVICQGQSRIEGTRAGTLKDVTRHAEEFTDNLNTRGSKIYSAYSSRSQKK